MCLACLIVSSLSGLYYDGWDDRVWEEGMIEIKHKWPNRRRGWRKRKLMGEREGGKWRTLLFQTATITGNVLYGHGHDYDDWRLLYKDHQCGSS